MIKLLEEGKYNLAETVNQVKILSLDDKKIYIWINADNIGEILITSLKQHKSHHILSVGNYRLYDVKDEKDLTDLLHLELHTGNSTWQGYLLPKGLPNNQKKRGRIIPTKEVITKTSYIGSLS